MGEEIAFKMGDFTGFRSALVGEIPPEQNWMQVASTSPSVGVPDLE